jgi:hypothetical protein
MKNYLEEKSALLTVLLGQLDDAEATFERIHTLETANAPVPDHDTLALQELLADAYDAAEALRQSVDAKVAGGRP